MYSVYWYLMVSIRDLTILPSNIDPEKHRGKVVFQPSTTTKPHYTLLTATVPHAATLGALTHEHSALHAHAIRQPLLVDASAQGSF